MKTKLSILFFLLISVHAFSMNYNLMDTLKFEGKDSTEYDIIVMDPGYDTYLASQPSKEFYSKEYYRSWNIQYVAEWNHRYQTSHSDRYATYIDYNPSIDYGLDLEYKLYYFFRFFEESNKIKLLPRVR